MKKLRNLFLTYAVSDRRRPHKNRERVGQNLMLLSIFLFSVFIINFAVIIGTDSKFGVDLSEGAQSVYQSTQIVQAKRGTIFDRNGEPIAEDSTTYSVYAILDTNYVDVFDNKLYVQSSQYNKVAEIFNSLLGMEKDYVIGQLSLPDLKQVSFGTKGGGLTYSKMQEVTQALEAAGIEGVAFETSPGRMYPNGTFASQFIGLAQIVEDENAQKRLVGQTGLEAAMNDILAGTDGTVIYQKDRNGNVLLGTETVGKQPVDGRDVYTTLSSPLQTYLESQMDIFQEKAKGVAVNATVLNAKTGEILATSQRPTFNADTKEGLVEGFNWKSGLYQSNFEPGSTMKVMLLASAIDAGVFNPNETFSNASLSIADAVIKDWDINQGLSSGSYLTYAQGFAHSSNIGMTLLEQKMGDDKWLNYLYKYRFGFPTRFGMGSEEAGFLPSDNIVSIAMSSFGQGINVTQIQMLRAFTAISNDGVMLEPKFISRIYDPNTGTSRTGTTEVVGNPVSATAAQQTRDYMVTVGTDPTYGTLQSEGVPVIQVGNESVAVKSGTAEIPAEDGSGYIEGAYLNSVVAMVPSADPDFIMYVTLQQPEKFSILFWQDIVNPVLEKAELLKDSLLEPVLNPADQQTAYKLEDLIGQSPGNTADVLRRNLVQPIILGYGSKITKVSEKIGSNLEENEQILLLTNKLEELPDMYGWTKKNVETFASWQGLKITFKGTASGRVTQQSINAGQSLTDVDKLTITLGE